MNERKYKYTRREFLINPFKKVSNIIDSGPANNLVEGSCELAAIGLALYTATEGGKDKLVTIGISPIETFKDKPNVLEQVQSSECGIANLATSLHELEDTWYSAYRKPRTEVYLDYQQQCTGSGSSRSCHTIATPKTRTVYYWEEPDELTSKGLDHSTISTWLNHATDLSAKLNDLQTNLPNTSTIENGTASYRLEEHPIDQQSRNWITTAGFGISAIAFTLYEEGASKNELLTSLANTRVKRRSILKLGTMAILSQKIKELQQTFASSNSGVKKDIEAHATEIIGQSDTPANVSYQKYFGESIDDTANLLSDIRAKITSSLPSEAASNIESWNAISSALTNVSTSTDASRSRFTGFYHYEVAGQYQIPAVFADALRKIWADTQIRSYVDGKNFDVNSQALTQVLIFAFSLAGIAIAQETILATSDTLVKKLKM